MNGFMDVVAAAGAASWGILLDSAAYILFGFALAGVVKLYLPLEFIRNSLGGRDVRSVARAAILGAPLPLCSCSVLPAAVALRKQGASKPAVTSFLISTPETGVDSIAISWALLDPIMTVFRPVAAVFTAMIAGVMEIFFGRESAAAGVDMETDDCCEKGHCAAAADPHPQAGGKIAASLHFSFVELMDDLAGWLMFGILMAGIVMAAIPEGMFGRLPGGGFGAMLVMLLIGAPMYICATSSTPLAAAMILKGLNPGAALVFLLAGPATNLASFMVVRDFLGTRSAVIYYAAIALGALSTGLALDGLYSLTAIDPAATLGRAAEMAPESVELASAIVLLGLFSATYARRWKKRYFSS